jgi:hypothetical protein
VIDKSWLLERIHGRLDEIHRRLLSGKSDPRFDPGMAQLAVGQGAYPEKALEAEPHAEVLANPALAFNNSQEHALRVATASPIVYLWGPAGTGKTRTVAAIAEEHMRSKRRVIVACPSNAATDVAAKAIADRLKGEPAFEHGEVLRVGPHPGSSLRRTYGDRMVPQLVAARMAEEEYGAERRELEERIMALKAHAQATREGAGARQPDDKDRDADSEIARCKAALYRLEEASLAYQERVFDKLLDNCRVLITTVHNIYLSRQVRGEWDVVIIDEASMVSIPQIYLAAGMATGSGDSSRHIIIAGDFRQLPPPVAYGKSDELPWLGLDVFHRLDIPRDIERGDDPPCLVMLDEQYRMVPEIGEFVGSMFYDGRLRTASSARRRARPHWALCGTGLAYLDTSQLSPRACVPSGTSTRENQVHARVVANLVASLTDPGGGSKTKDLLILSPYTGQVDRLHRGILPVTRAAGISGIAVASVHRAQGSEASTLVFTIDDAPGAAPSQFMSARDLSAAGARLLNVALSRAQGRAVVVLDMAYLRRCGGPVVREFIYMLKQEGAAIDPDDIDGEWERRFGAPFRW